MILDTYLVTGNVPLAKRYIELNGIVRLEVCRHHLGDKGFQLWEMTGETTGLPTEFRLKREAIAAGKRIAEFTGLPLVIL